MIVSLDKNNKLRLKYDKRSYIIHSHNNHYYIVKDNVKVYCTKQVNQFHKDMSPQSTHTINEFEMNGNRYLVEELNNKYCVRKNNMFICKNEVQEIIKKLQGGVPVDFVGTTLPEPSFIRKTYADRRSFIDKLEIEQSSESDADFPIIKYVDVSAGKTYLYTMKNELSSGAFGVAALMETKDDISNNNVPSKFVLKKFFKINNDRNRNFKIANYENELAKVNELHRDNLFTESTYARVITDQYGQSFVLMELAEGDVFSFTRNNTSIINHCNTIKLVYAMFHEIYNMFNKSGYLYADIKLENFLYTRENDNKGFPIFHVVMADYGSLGTLNEGFTKKDSNNKTIFTGVSITNAKNLPKWKNNWENVAFNLGCTILYELGIQSLDEYDYKYKTEYDFIRDVENMFNSHNSKTLTVAERNLVESLLGVTVASKIYSNNSVHYKYEILRGERLLDTPEKIIGVFKTYKKEGGCGLIEIGTSINKPSIFKQCFGQCGVNDNA